MKTKFSLLVFLSFLLATGCSQNNNRGTNLNLNFEDIQDGKPVGWFAPIQKNYSVSLDSVTVKSGKYSIAIEYVGDSTYFQSITLGLPNNYSGKRMVLSGYIKTENVDGYAGLWLRIDPNIGFADMSKYKVAGTNDWKKYKITLPMNPTKSKQIYVGGMLVGKGKIWLDGFHITIDGKDISEAKVYEREPVPAENDKEFDTGSNIAFPELKEKDINNLDLLGRIWGFLKYHHPAIATKNYNWDYELFRMLSEYLKITDSVKRDEFLLQWIGKYGEIPRCETCEETPVGAFLKPDLSWVDKSNMNQKLKDLLHTIYLNRDQKNHYYTNLEITSEHPEFLHEDSYYLMTYPDAGFRLLALYRYWNIIQYFYPYKYLTDKNWDTVLKEYISKFILAKTQLDYELTVLKLIGETSDSDAQLWEGRQKIDSLRGYWIAPFQVRLIENQLVVTKYYNPDLQDATGLNVGDIITQINGKAVKAIVDSVKEYYPASNEAARMRDVANDIMRSENQTIQIKYISSNQVKQKDLTLYDLQKMYQYIYPKDTTKCYKLSMIGNIGYITMKRIEGEDINNIKNDFINTKGIIIDIRNYPSAYVTDSLGSYFVSKSTPFVKNTKGNPDNPGEFTFSSPLEIPKPEVTYQGKLVVLVNEETQNYAEYVAMAFRAGKNTTIIGSQTAGAEGNLADIYLPGGLKIHTTCTGIYYPDGQPTQRVGIVPDIVVKPTIKGIREGRDELLEKAFEIINSGK